MIANRTQRLELAIGVIATGVLSLALAIYILLEPTRIQTAQADTLAVQIDDAMTLYAENCAVCHGLQGEGIGSVPSLDSDGLRTMSTEDLTKIIARGRLNTAMPAWSQSDGGPLSDYQIFELVRLIQSGDWLETRDRVVNLGLAPLIPFTTDPDPALLDAVGSLQDGQVLQTAITIFSAECVSCHGADGLGTSIAPALNDPAVRAKSADELTRTITFGSAGTLMSGWSNVLLPEEISAMVTLIQRWDEIPTGTIPAPEVPIPTTAESIALGGQLYASNCAMCHGPEGQGTQRAPSLNVKSFLTSTNDQAIEQIVTNGVPGTAMPAWGTRMTESEIQAIVGFIRQWEPTAPEVASPIRGAGGPPWLRNTQTGPAVQPVAPAKTPQPPANQPATVTQQPAGNKQGGGGPAWAQQNQPAGWVIPDWRILLGITALLSIAFTLIFSGLSFLRK